MCQFIFYRVDLFSQHGLKAVPAQIYDILQKYTTHALFHISTTIGDGRSAVHSTTQPKHAECGYLTYL